MADTEVETLQQEILGRLPHSFKLIVGNHSEHWNYSKLETLERLADWLERHDQEEWARAKKSVESEVYSQMLDKFRDELQEAYNRPVQVLRRVGDLFYVEMIVDDMRSGNAIQIVIADTPPEKSKDNE